MHYPVNRRGGGHGVGKGAFPLGEDQVGRDAQGPALVAFGDEGEENLGLLVALGEVAQEQEVEVVQLAQLSGQGEVALGGEEVLQVVRSVEREDARLTLCALSPDVLGAFQASGLVALVDICSSRTDAVAAVGG